MSVQWIRDRFLEHGNRRFIDGYSFSWVYERAQSISYSLLEAGLEPLDRVVVQFWNEIDFVTHYFGVLLAGGVAVTVSPMLTEYELDHIRQHSKARYIFNSRSVGSLITLDSVEQSLSSPGDLAAVIYTSGTTAAPKGVMLTYRNIMAQVRSASEAINLQSSDSFLGVLSLSHVFGQMDVLWASLDKGCQIYLVQRYSPELALSRLYNSDPSIIIAVPTMYQSMLAYLERHRSDFKTPLSSLRLCHSGATPLPVVLFDRLNEEFSVPVQEGYGLTETCSMAFSNPLGKEKPGSVGKPISGVDLLISNDGEILIKGDIVTEGYLFAEDLTSQAINERGYLHTGDIGHIDSEGYLFITGRLKDLIIRGGYKIYPREIEEALLLNENVEQVAVAMMEDSERLVAFVVPKIADISLIDDLKSIAEEKLSKYKRPNIYKLVEKLPQTPSGKIQRYKLKSS